MNCTRVSTAADDLGVCHLLRAPHPTLVLCDKKVSEGCIHYSGCKAAMMLNAYQTSPLWQTQKRQAA